MKIPEVAPSCYNDECHTEKLFSLQLCNSEDDLDRSRFETQMFSLERPETIFCNLCVEMTNEQSSSRWERLERWQTKLRLKSIFRDSKLNFLAKFWELTTKFWELVNEILKTCQQILEIFREIPRTFSKITKPSSHSAITATPSQPKLNKFYLFHVTILFSIKYISVFDFYKNTILRYFWSHVVKCTSDDETQLRGTELIENVVKRWLASVTSTALIGVCETGTA